ncbi:MAG: DUF1697 domain-containing protein [Sphingomonadaceae bacterium]|nr:DUF1697 domain-containing protein [Sphingomonadaceae bacterium]
MANCWPARPVQPCCRRFPLADRQYAVLLSRINVGGNRLKMAELKSALEAAHFPTVQTIAASGNVVLESGLAAGGRQSDHCPAHAGGIRD